MKTSLKLFSLAVFSIPVLVSGCASEKTTTKLDSAKGHYITLPPETGSRVPRRVWVAEDGKVSDPASPVQKVSPSVLGELQRKGSANRGGGQ